MENTFEEFTATAPRTTNLDIGRNESENAATEYQLEELHRTNAIAISEIESKIKLLSEQQTNLTRIIQDQENQSNFRMVESKLGVIKETLICPETDNTEDENGSN